MASGLPPPSFSDLLWSHLLTGQRSRKEGERLAAEVAGQVARETLRQPFTLPPGFGEQTYTTAEERIGPDPRAAGPRTFVCQGCGVAYAVLHGGKVACPCGTTSAAEVLPPGG